jgi:hypothetical protein
MHAAIDDRSVTGKALFVGRRINHWFEMDRVPTCLIIGLCGWFGYGLARDE